jgi:hypothetical protein
MSAKITFAALAALLTALSVQGPASARTASHDNRPSHAVSGFRARIPADAFGAVGDPAPFARSSSDVTFGGRTLGRDPDANVRMQLLRDFDHNRE